MLSHAPIPKKTMINKSTLKTRLLQKYGKIDALALFDIFLLYF